MSHKEESLDEKIARIRKQNEEIQRRKKLIDEEIKDAERNNAILKLKNKVQEADLNDEFGATLYSDQLSPEKKVVKSFEEDIWNVKPRPRKSAPQINKTDEEWREERKRIDEERIRRQKANSGSWKREWDADKTASSNDHDNRTSKDVANRYNRNSSVAERPDNRGTFNESRGSYNNYYTNEDDNMQNRWKTDSSFRKTYSERRTTDNYDNRKSTRNDSWRTNVSESDLYNNNTAKSFSKNISRAGTQNAPFPTKNNQLEEESWDTGKSNLKINSQNDTQITPFATKNDQFKEENWDSALVKDVQSVKQKSNNWHPVENAKPQAKSQEKDRSSVALNRSRLSCGFNNRFVQPNRSSNASNSRISKSPEIKRKITGENELEVNDCETSGIISKEILKDLKNIVVQVGNLGISSKREVKKFGDLKSDSNVPNFSFNVNTSREVDSKTSPSYGSMTFERSDLKQKITPTYFENLSSPSSIATQLFSNSKLSDVDANTKSSNFTRMVKNDEQKSTTMFQSPTVFQFSATPSKPDFGDIVHNISTPQDVKIIRTIKSENIMLVKESPKRNISTETKKTKDAKRNKDIQHKTNEVVQNEESEEGELDEDEEWDDCSDEEVEEEFI